MIFSEQQNIQYAPSMVFFDSKGDEVFRADGYLKAFHVQSIMDYVASYAYKTQPNFQRYIEDRAEKLRSMGIEVDIMKWTREIVTILKFTFSKLIFTKLINAKMALLYNVLCVVAQTWSDNLQNRFKLNFTTPNLSQ